MSTPATKLPSTAWKPGQSGNPAGRPRSSKHKIQEDFLADLHADWKRFGIRAIARCRHKRPDAYLKVFASLMPRDVNIQVDIIQRLAQLTPEERANLITAMRARKLAALGQPAEPVTLDGVTGETVTTPVPVEESST